MTTRPCEKIDGGILAEYWGCVPCAQKLGPSVSSPHNTVLTCVTILVSEHISLHIGE